MVFDLIAKSVGDVVGTVLGVSAAVIAEALDLPIQAVKAAKEAGCETYDEVRDWCKDNFKE